MLLTNEDLLAISQVVDTRLDIRLKPMEQDIKELKEDVAVLKEDVADLKQDVAVLKEDVTGLKQDVACQQQISKKFTETMKTRYMLSTA